MEPSSTSTPTVHLTFDRKVSSRRREVVHLDDKILALKHQRNSLIPVGHLPPEILATVFAIYVANPPQKYILRSYWWLTILHVCSRWRQIVLTCPRLWTSIDPGDPELVATVLQLSKGLPLTIQLWSDMDHCDAFKLYELVLPHLSRFRAAYMQITPEVVNLLKSETVKLEAPLLESLGMALESNLGDFSDMSLPRLQTLNVVSGTRDILQSLLRPTLTDLALTDHPTQPRELVDLFASLPSLQKLRIRHCARNGLEDPGLFVPPTRTVHLSQLKALWMDEEEGRDAAHAYLLDRFTLPDTAKFRFFGSEIFALDDTAMVLESLRSKSHLRSGAMMCPRTICISGMPALQICLFTDRQPLDCLDWSASRVWIQLNPEGMLLKDQVVRFLCGSVDLSEVITLHVEAFSFGLWSAFAAMAKLEELVLMGDALDHNFAMAMSEARMFAGNMGFLFPSLKVLKLRRMKMKLHPTRHYVNDKLEYLVSMLLARAANGLRLQRLAFVSPYNIRDADYEMLASSGGAEEIVKGTPIGESWSECSSVSFNVVYEGEDEDGNPNGVDLDQ